jgi:hypothetical protein
MTDETTSPAVEAGPVPPLFRTTFARAALMGDAGALDRAFNWDGSKQGHDYWNAQWYKLKAKKPLSPEAASILRAWIKGVEARS